MWMPERRFVLLGVNKILSSAISIRVTGVIYRVFRNKYTRLYNLSYQLLIFIFLDVNLSIFSYSYVIFLIFDLKLDISPNPAETIQYIHPVNAAHFHNPHKDESWPVATLENASKYVRHRYRNVQPTGHWL
jgi:hypothetical protein